MSEKADSQNNAIIADTSVIIEYLEGSEMGKRFFQHVFSDPQIMVFYFVPIVDTEVKYILCRRKGYKEGLEIANNFFKDFTVYDGKNLRDKTAYLKCHFSISLADCYSLAAGILLGAPVYMKRETEIEDVRERLEKLVILKFINDI